MSSLSRPQAQWSIDNTIFKSVEVLLELYQAARDDDIQSAAVMALEALGSRLLVSPERIDDGKAALGNVGLFERLQSVLVNIGVMPGGVAHFMRRTGTQCIAAFVLAASLKTFLSDEQIGDVFYEMLIHQGLIQKPELRCSRDQLSKVVSVISGYTDGIIPTATVATIFDALKRTSNLSPHWMKRAHARLGGKELAKIFSAVYESLQKEEIDIVILKGITGCVFVASSLLWLQGDDVQIFVDNHLITESPASPPKLSIQLTTAVEPETDFPWRLEEWRETTLISSMIVFDSSSDRVPLALPNFVPAHTARAILKGQYELSEAQIKQVGRIATALVLVVIERGLVTAAPSTPGGAPRELRLQRFCQKGYLANVTRSMVCYGWKEDEVCGAEDFANEIKNWTEHGFQGLDENEISQRGHPLGGKPIECIIWILEFVSKLLVAKTGSCDHEIDFRVAEPAIYVAAESIYSSLCSRLPRSRFFRTGNYVNVTYNGASMLHWIIRHEGLVGRKDTPKKMALLAAHGITSIDLQSIRCNCMASLLPAAATGVHDLIGQISPATTGINRDDLAYAVNGYVAWLPQLRAISTMPRDAMAVEITAGYMRWDGTQGDPNATLMRIQAEESTYQLYGDKEKQPARTDLHPFDRQDEYIGFQPFPDIHGLQIKHHWHQSGRVLSFRTDILHPASGQIYPVNWMQSIEALVNAKHLANQRLTRFAEKALADAWQMENIWPSITLVPGVANLESGATVGAETSAVRWISRTYGNEELRFFFAGNVSIHNLYVCHGDVSVVKSIQTALEDEENSRMSGWRRFPAASDRIEDWMHPMMARDIVSPGWVIIL